MFRDGSFDTKLRVIKIVWGFVHPAKVEWRDGDALYRTLKVAMLTPAELSQRIVNETPDGEKISAIYLAADAFMHPTDDRLSIADQMSEVFRSYDLPFPTPMWAAR